MIIKAINSSTCVLEVDEKGNDQEQKKSSKRLLQLNINLDSTKIIITGHKIVASLLLLAICLFYY